MRTFAGLTSSLILGTSLLLAACGSETSEVPPDAPAIVIINDAAPDARPDAMPLPDAFVPPDGRVPELSCLGNTLPDTAADPVVITGIAQTIDLASQALAPLAGVTVTGHLVADDSEIATADPTATDGTFSISVTTNGLPVDGYVKLINPADTTYLETRIYPPAPLVQDLAGNRGMMFNDGLLSVLANFGLTHDQSTKGIVGILVLDCNGEPVIGATVTLNPASGQIFYNGPNGTPSPAATETAGDGLALIFNVDAGDVEIGAEVGGQQMRKHTIKSVVRTISTAAIAP